MIQKLSYTIPQAYEATGIKPRTLREYCVTKKLAAKLIGKNWIIPTESLLKLLETDSAAASNGATNNG